MKIVFVSNFLNHHQIPFCINMQEFTNNNFFFISMDKMPEERVKMGYKFDEKYSFEVDGIKEREYAHKLVLDADVVIYAAMYSDFVRERIKRNKLSFCYSERIYKRGIWRILSPKGIYNMIRNHGICRNKKVYLLCASAYASFDYSLTGNYIGKSFKWGYFPEYKEYDIDKLIEKKQKNDAVNIVWVARFISWKHPEYAVMLAEKLKDSGYNFKINMIGPGEMFDDIDNMIKQKDLSDKINLLGSMKPNQVREHMENANIFIFTSDFEEGWGAVLNEAMNSGCAVVASHAIGAAPFLIKHQQNGLIYKNGDIEDLTEKVADLIDNKEKTANLGKEAYLSIKDYWNSDKAAERLYSLCDSMLNNKEFYAEYGPCNRAECIPQWKMYKKVTGLE